MTGTTPPDSRQAALSTLRAAVARLERGSGGSAASTVMLCQAIDRALPGGGLPRAAIHEVLLDDPGATAAFCGLVLARASGPVVWIGSDPDVRPDGLAEFGLCRANLILVGAKRSQDGLWAFAEALRSPGVAGAVLMRDGPAPDLVTARRLQLAAEAGGGIGLLVLPDTDIPRPSAARSRWRVSAAAATRFGNPVWRLTLLRCSGGQPQSWTVTWDRATQQLTAADAPADTNAWPVAARA